MTIGALTSPLRDEPVELEPGPGPLAVAQPADPRRQALERNALAGHRQPALEIRLVGEQLEQRPVGPVDVLRIAATAATHRKGPLPSQKSGRRNAGTKPG